MSKWQEMYKKKLTSPEEIVGQIKSGDVCCCPSALGEPAALVEALAERALREDITGITHHMLLACRKWKYLSPELAGRIIHVAWFTSGAARPAVQEGRADYMPNFYHEVPRYWREYREPDVFYAMVSPMDKHGYFSFGVAASEPRAQMSRAKKIFLEVNQYMPRVHGSAFVHISEVDALCEAHIPLPELPSEPLSEIDIIMGNSIAEMIPDGATIQLGIGGIPNAVGKALMTKKDLGIHSEMFTDSMVDLIEAGVVTNKKKNINTGKSIASFAFGSRRMYDYLDDNPGVEFHPVDYVNEPTIIGLNDNFISINACLEVDLLGQVCSESIGPKNFSGTGGQVDFVRGANRSKGGKAFIAMYSTAKNNTISKIKPMLTEGAVVTTSKNDVDYIVTEYGIAKLKGKTASERAKALIAIAHPNFREELTFAARKMNLII
ncbi:MAG: 4-hydroxybutyrate coenzyme transferase [Peptococcaceae bacterium]|jgi:acyl-CoA hydrolase|nr:4-hydroxybutyrate coenzyme transferase [Peptococcaceae bacterium]